MALANVHEGLNYFCPPNAVGGYGGSVVERINFELGNLHPRDCPSNFLENLKHLKIIAKI